MFRRVLLLDNKFVGVKGLLQKIEVKQYLCAVWGRQEFHLGRSRFREVVMRLPR